LIKFGTVFVVYCSIKFKLKRKWMEDREKVVDEILEKYKNFE